MKSTLAFTLSTVVLSIVALSPHPAVAGGTVVARFDAATGQLPEGIAATRDALYVGIAGSGEVRRIGADGTHAPFGRAPAPLPGKGFLTGLIVTDDGDVLVALASFAPDVQAGIYRIPKTGGKASLFARHDDMSFPNGLAFDAAGHLLVTDSGGAVFRVSPAGDTRRILRDPRLQGDKSGASSPAAPGARFGLDIGVNGIAVADDGTVFLANSDKASILSFRYDANSGTASALRIVAQHAAKLGGADGIALADDGDVLVALNTQNRIVRVDTSGWISEVAAGPALDFPASIVRAPGREGAFYVTNAAFLSDAKRPSVVEFDVD